MPIYVYRNLVTGDTFEVQQPITADALRVHPDTGEPVKRIVQPVGIAFKGSGFYVTDSRGSKAGAGVGNGAATGNGATKGDGPSAGDGATKEKQGTAETAGASSDAGSKAPANAAASPSTGASAD